MARPTVDMEAFRRYHLAVSEPKFLIGDRVTKKKGSNWTGVVVGYYSSTLTPLGVCVESDTERGSVQIYPIDAVEPLWRGERHREQG